MSEEKMTPEQLKKSVERFSHQISEIDPLATAVLKAHFAVEEFLDLTLDEVAESPKYLERNPSFVRKVNWLRAFAPLGEDSHWNMILAFNTVRNKRKI